jgi:hypothetical protein
MGGEREKDVKFREFDIDIFLFFFNRTNYMDFLKIKTILGTDAIYA